MSKDIEALKKERDFLKRNVVRLKHNGFPLVAKCLDKHMAKYEKLLAERENWHTVFISDHIYHDIAYAKHAGKDRIVLSVQVDKLEALLKGESE